MEKKMKKLSRLKNEVKSMEDDAEKPQKTNESKSKYRELSVWSITHVTDKAKDIAKIKAKQKRLKIGEWISKLIENDKDKDNLEDSTFNYNSLMRENKIIYNSIKNCNLNINSLERKIDDIYDLIQKTEDDLPKKTFMEKFFGQIDYPHKSP